MHLKCTHIKRNVAKNCWRKVKFLVYLSLFILSKQVWKLMIPTLDLVKANTFVIFWNSYLHYFCKIFIYDTGSPLLTLNSLISMCAANLILFEEIFPLTCLIRAYTFIYFRGKFPPTRLLEPPPLLILGGNPNYKIILSSFKLWFWCFKHFKAASKS